MELKNCATALFVKNIEVSKRFYTEILGHSVALDFGKNIIFTTGLAIWEIKTDHIIPLSLGFKNISDESVNRFELYFETENIQQVYNDLKKKDIPFVHEIHEEPWGQYTIRFFDPDKHLIEIGESMRQFIFRFYKQGLTVPEIHEKTSVPTEEINRILNQQFYSDLFNC